MGNDGHKRLVIPGPVEVRLKQWSVTAIARQALVGNCFDAATEK